MQTTSREEIVVYVMRAMLVLGRTLSKREKNMMVCGIQLLLAKHLTSVKLLSAVIQRTSAVTLAFSAHSD